MQSRIGFELKTSIPINKISHASCLEKNISLSILRLDQTDPYISGNKWFKLKYNLMQARQQACQTLLSFGGPYWTYSPEGFPIADYPMVAPFWGDVDTRSLEDNAGVVWMKTGPGWLAITWDHVGYYSSHTDLQNTFQLIISDGSADAPPGLNNNVCFCYGDMSWTTGDASDGEGGFGGSPATVGVNKGDGIDFFNIGRLDPPAPTTLDPTGSAASTGWTVATSASRSAARRTSAPWHSISRRTTPWF